jgi:Cu(I)/Ag(I) efflux system membrane fusion protein
MQQDMPGMHDMPGMQHGTPAAAPPATGQAAVDYTCPMHAQVHQDHPGNCPICGMTLVKTGAATTGPAGGGK